MSTIIGHILAGTTIGLAVKPPAKKERLAKEWALQIIYAIFFSILADFDVALGLISGGTIFSLHRQGTHTLIFAAGVTFIIYIGIRWMLKRGPKKAWHWSSITCLAMVCHLILDYWVQPLYLREGMHIYNGQERTVWEAFLPLLRGDGPSVLLKEVAMFVPLIVIAFIARLRSKN